ncbi:MAG: TolC family protein [Thermoanaerobaculia bacterium]
MSRTLTAVLTLALAVLPLYAETDQTPPPVPPDPVFASSPQLGLNDAILLTLRKDPGLQTAEENKKYERGVLQETSGIFDHALLLDGDAEYLRGELIPRTFNQQLGRRELYNSLATIFQRVADDLQANLDEKPNETATIPCKEGVLTEGTQLVITDPSNGQQIIVQCTPPTADQTVYIDEALDTLIGAQNNPGLEAELERLKKMGVEISRQKIEEIIALLDQSASSFREQLRRLGTAPNIEEQISFLAAIGYRVPMRNGVTVTPRFAVQSIEKNFVGKPKDPNYGGGGPTKYQAAAGFELTAPLARGYGMAVADVYEQAAKINYKASVNDWRQTASASTLNSVLAYWNLLAAEQNLQIASSTADRYRNVLDLGQALVDAYEFPRADMNQVRARVAGAESSLAGARKAVSDARVALARTTGMEIDTIDQAPVATGDFPPVPDPALFQSVPVRSLIDMAIGNRGDVQAAIDRKEAAALLREAARKNLKPQTDLTLFVGYTGNDANYDAWRGLRHALFGNWIGPTAYLTLNFETPFQNNVWRGRLVQAVATENQSDVIATDTRRVVSARVVELWGALARAAESVRTNQSTVEYYQRTVDGQIEKLKVGEGTLIDAIFTEQQLTTAKQSLVAAKLGYASLLMQLRYETGTLVTTGSQGQLMIVPGGIEQPPVP